jgi:hypothetical protein
MNYPEHEKMRRARAQSQAIGEFLDWLIGNGFTIERNEMSHNNFEALLAEFFDIDLKKVETEKRQMLELIRYENDNDRPTFVDQMILNEAQASVALDNDEVGTYAIDEMPSHGDKGE